MQTCFDLLAFVSGQWPDKDGRAPTLSAKGPAINGGPTVGTLPGG